MIKLIGFFLYCGLVIIAAHNENAHPSVQSSAGVIQGSILKTRLGKNLYAFRGIRYGEPPLGRNRFKQAIPARPFTSPFDATQDAPSCIQPIMYNRTISEDCLRLNIYTTRLPEQSSENLSDLKDVVVYIHPGGFYYYSGGTFDVGPEYLLDRDIIFVTINYRLGALGFLSTGDSRAPGNAGFKDQVLALKWIQKHIRSFGGNPNSVTLLGYGSGASTVSLHMVSPLSKNLFHRGIMMSPFALTQKPLPRNLNNIAIKEAELLNCPTDLSDSTFECFYNKKAEDFAHPLPKFDKGIGNSRLVYLPVIEPINSNNTNEEEAFLTAQPFDVFRERKANFVPLLIGSNRDEISFALKDAQEQALNGNNSWYDEFNRRFEEVAPKLFHYESDTPKSAEISRELKSFYLNDKPIGVENYQGLANIYKDVLMLLYIHRIIRLSMNYSSEPIYAYYYTYPGCQSFAKWSNGTNFGVSHYDELILLFKVGFGYPPPCEKDLKTQERLTGIIESFAKTGDPKPLNNAYHLNIDWPPATKNNSLFINIGEEFKMEYGILHRKRVEKLEELFPLSSNE